jgi:hypothetical protein
MVFWYGTNGKKKPYRSIPEVCSDLIIEVVNKVGADPDDDDDTGTLGTPEIVELIKRDAVVCPHCHSQLLHKGGCRNCSVCGWSQC